MAIDVSGNGQLPWPPSTQPANAPTQFHNITLFLTSLSLSHNFTVSNGTVPPGDNEGYVGPILNLEASSTVKHVNWIWPKCFVGEGTDSNGSARGKYNISVHQSFRLNGTDYYTVFELPISVTNSITESSKRIECDLLENTLIDSAQVDKSSDVIAGQGQSSIQSGVQTNTAPNLLLMTRTILIFATVLAVIWPWLG